MNDQERFLRMAMGPRLAEPGRVRRVCQRAALLDVMRMAGIEEAGYAYSNDEAEPYGLSTAAVYADLARPFAEQPMRILHLPVRLDAMRDLYAEWRRREPA